MSVSLTIGLWALLWVVGFGFFFAFSGRRLPKRV
jgi:hypothetical protein